MKSIITAVLLVFSFPVLAKKAELNNSGGVFLDGYDPVSYIQDNKAIKGSKSFSHEHKGSKIFFSSEANRDKFVEKPEAYLPAYNGWCAYAMANGGSLVEVDPTQFKVIDGKAYLFYKGFFADTLKKWNKKPDAPQIKTADKTWAEKHQ